MTAIRSQRRKWRRRRSEGNDGDFIWLISMSDLMMLLFVFFVVLFSFTWKRLKSDNVFKMSNSLDSLAQEQAHGLKSEDGIAHAAITPIDTIQANLLRWVTQKKLLDSVDVVRKEDALILEIKEKLFFELGEANLKPEAEALLPVLREALAHVPGPYRIGIEGHTDDTPVHGGQDNCYLSSQRALKVREALHLPAEMESRTVIMAYGATRPLVPNHYGNGRPLPENQAQNRRVTIRVF